MIADKKDGSGRPQNSLKRRRLAAAIVFVLRQADIGTVVAEVCRKMGISEATFYNRCGGPLEEKVWWSGHT